MTIEVSPEVLYKIGLALESGCSEETQRKMWGDETIDWFNEVEKRPEYQAFVKAWVL